jgi:hypothetical protein
MLQQVIALEHPRGTQHRHRHARRRLVRTVHAKSGNNKRYQYSQL